MQIDYNSYRSIYKLNYDALYKFLGFYTRSRSIIEDVIQNVFVKLWEDRDRVEISHIKTYLFHSARNTMINTLQKDYRRLILLEKWFDEQQYNDNSVDCFDIDALYDKAQQAINSLPPKCKEIYILKNEKKMTYQEIADNKSISVKTVENQLGIALKKIRDFIVTNSFILLSEIFFSKF